MKIPTLTADQQVTYDLSKHLADQVRDAYRRVLSLEPDADKQAAIASGGLLSAARMTVTAAALATGQAPPKDMLAAAIALLYGLREESKKMGML